MVIFIHFLRLFDIVGTFLGGGGSWLCRQQAMTDYFQSRICHSTPRNDYAIETILSMDVILYGPMQTYLIQISIPLLLRYRKG
jgi:hypothetical protein